MAPLAPQPRANQASQNGQHRCKPVSGGEGHVSISLPSDPPSFSCLPAWAILLVAILTLLGMGLRFYRLADQSLWNDEVASIVTAMQPLGQVYTYSMKMNNSLPTYFLLLHPLLPDDGGNLEFRARFLSALAGGLSVPL